MIYEIETVHGMMRLPADWLARLIDRQKGRDRDERVAAEGERDSPVHIVILQWSDATRRRPGPRANSAEAAEASWWSVTVRTAGRPLNA
jgi:hypothetical protein